ncbi:MAG: hypothetical protein M1121_04915 [Actinobacteria bacterium]|nr:hypothetical protein [Actinomycetota bacterium]
MTAKRPLSRDYAIALGTHVALKNESLPVRMLAAGIVGYYDAKNGGGVSDEPTPTGPPCADKANLFYSTRPDDQARSISICESCQFIARCASDGYAIEKDLPAHQIYGVRAGKTPVGRYRAYREYEEENSRLTHSAPDARSSVPRVCGGDPN